MPPNEWVQRPITLVRLPEVIREILLEYLPREDKESLARVCKGWGVTVQRYMFSSVHLRWDDGPRYSTQWVPSVLGNLHLIITSNPIIATYIKSLIIEDGSDTGLYAPWFLNQTDVLTDVFDIIQSHSPLRKLVITSNYKPFYWSFLKPGVRWKVLELLEKSTLEYVEIDAIRMLSEEFFMRCRSVKTLVVRQCGFPYLNMYRKKRLWDTIGVPTGTVRLESLRIDFSAFDPDLSITPFLHVNNGLNLSKLRELTLWSCHKYPPSYRVFCDIRTLKHLNIIWVPPEEDDVVHYTSLERTLSRHFNFAYYRNLESLSISILLPTDHYKLVPTISALAVGLSTISSSVLETVRLRLDIPYRAQISLSNYVEPISNALFELETRAIDVGPKTKTRPGLTKLILYRRILGCDDASITSLELDEDDRLEAKFGWAVDRAILYFGLLEDDWMSEL